MKKLYLSKKLMILLLIIAIIIPIASIFIINYYNQPQYTEENTWIQTNGPYGGIIHTIEIDTSQPNILYAGGAGGVFKSYDAGITWDKLPRFLEGYKRVEKIILSPEDSQTLYTITESPVAGIGGEVYKSTNGGQNWTKIDQDLKFKALTLYINNATDVIGCTITKQVLYSNNGGSNWTDISSNLQNDGAALTDVAISGENRFWVGTKHENNGSGSLYYTTNGGIFWDPVDIDQPPDTSIRSILVHPENNDIIYVSLEKAYDKIANPAESYLFKTEDGGVNWGKIYPPNPVRILGIFPNSVNDTLYLAHGNLIYKTSNNGFNWVRIEPNLTPGISTGDFRDIAIDPNDGNILYLPASSNGYFRSTNEGISWERITQRLLNVAVVLMAVPNVVGSDTVYVGGWDGEGTFRTDNAGESWTRLDEGGITHSFPDEIQVNPIDPRIVWEIADFGELYVSTNFGINWTSKFNAHSSDGFRFGSVHALAPAPSDSNVIYAVKSGYGIFKSTDGGNKWEFLRHSEVDYTYSLAIHPTNSNIVYSGYNPKPFQDWAMVRKTTDGGDSWKTVLNVSSSKGITSVAIDFNNPNTIYAGSISEQGGEIYKSINAGVSWAKLNDNFTMCTVMGQPQLIVDPNNPSIAYTGTWLAGTWKTFDGGINWELLHEAPVSATALSIDPQNSNNIFLADRSTPTLWKSSDGGATWNEIADFSSDGAFLVNRVVADGSTIYCATFGPSELTGKLYKSTDNGATWTDITGVLPRSVLDLVINPINPDNVYVTTHLFGAYNSSNGGIDWSELQNFPDIGAFDIEIDTTDPTILYSCGLGNMTIPTWVSSEGHNFTDDPGIYKSIDSGQNWTQILTTSNKVRAIRLHPDNHSVVFAAVHSEGLMVSTDGGTSWSSYNTNLDSTVLTSLAINEEKIYVGTQGFGIYSGEINLNDYSVVWQADSCNKPIPQVFSMQIIIDPENSSRIFVGAYPGGLYRSDDGGATFYDKNFQTHSIIAEDPFRQGYYSFALNPNNTDEVWLGTWGHGMFKSYDGMDFNAISLGTNFTMLGKHVYQVVVDSDSTVYAATEEGIYSSSNGGDTWINISKGLDNLQVRTVAITTNGTLLCGTLGYELYSYNSSTHTWEQMTVFDGFGVTWPIWNDRPNYQYTTLLFHPTDPNIIYLGAFPSGMYKSINGGKNWKEINVGWTNDGVFSLKFHPNDPEIIYAGTYNGVSRSVDAGAHWEIWDEGWPAEQWTFAIDIDPQNPNIMYACSKNGENEGIGRPNFHGTVMKSIDGGTSWFSITTGLNLNQEFYQISVDKNNPEILYLCTQMNGVFISDNAGDSWEPWNEGMTTLIAGTNSNNVAQPMVQTVDGRYIYFGTADSGVFRRKAVGTSMVEAANISINQISSIRLFWSIPLFEIGCIPRKKRRNSYFNQKLNFTL